MSTLKISFNLCLNVFISCLINVTVLFVFNINLFLCVFAAMESTSVYMCFPCYREFPTLEEVLAHQVNCNAENPQLVTNETPVETAAAAAGLPQV